MKRKSSFVSKLVSSPKIRNIRIFNEENISQEYNCKKDDLISYDHSNIKHLFESNLDQDQKHSIKNKGPVKSSFDSHISKSINKEHNITNERKFYCPFCQHCNQLKDDYLDDHIYLIRESRSVITKGLEHIIQSNIMNDLDIFKINEEDNSSKQYFEVNQS